MQDLRDQLDIKQPFNDRPRAGAPITEVSV